MSKFCWVALPVDMDDNDKLLCILFAGHQGAHRTVGNANTAILWPRAGESVAEVSDGQDHDRLRALQIVRSLKQDGFTGLGQASYKKALQVTEEVAVWLRTGKAPE